MDPGRLPWVFWVLGRRGVDPAYALGLPADRAMTFILDPTSVGSRTAALQQAIGEVVADSLLDKLMGGWIVHDFTFPNSLPV